MILFDVFDKGRVPDWLVNIEADIDSRMSELATKDPDCHPLNIRTEEREKILTSHNATMLQSNENGTQSWKIMFSTMEDYSWFMLRWG
jgi:hypothetical protein